MKASRSENHPCNSVVIFAFIRGNRVFSVVGRLLGSLSFIGGQRLRFAPHGQRLFIAPELVQDGGKKIEIGAVLRRACDGDTERLQCFRPSAEAALTSRGLIECGAATDVEALRLFCRDESRSECARLTLQR